MEPFRVGEQVDFMTSELIMLCMHSQFKVARRMFRAVLQVIRNSILTSRQSSLKVFMKF